MALTDAQKVKIRGYLGYQLDSVEIDTALSSLSLSAESEVVSVLASLANVDSKLTTIAPDVAGLSNASTTKFYQGQIHPDLVKLGNDLIGRLASFLGIEVVRSPYGSGSGSVSGVGFSYFGA